MKKNEDSLSFFAVLGLLFLCIAVFCGLTYSIIYFKDVVSVIMAAIIILSIIVFLYEYIVLERG
jgi:hypothetical protein